MTAEPAEGSESYLSQVGNVQYQDVSSFLGMD